VVGASGGNLEGQFMNCPPQCGIRREWVWAIRESPLQVLSVGGDPSGPRIDFSCSLPRRPERACASPRGYCVTNSTRRFLAFPSSVSFEATGAKGPTP